MPDWERELGALPRGTHALLLHRGPVLARRVAGRFAAEGLRLRQAVVLSGEGTEIEQITVTLSSQGVDVEGEHGRNRLLLLHCDEDQAARLAVNLEHLLGWVEDQVQASEVRIWNHWAGTLTERGLWQEAMALEAAIGDLKGSATVLCHHDVGRMEDPQGRLDGLAILHDAVFAPDEPESGTPRPAALAVAPVP
jgi:hypothetical protein